MNILISTLVVFSIVLVITKSRVLSCKREFVKKRYEAAKLYNQKPSWPHIWFHAIWTCPMCCGFWVAIPVCYFYPQNNVFIDVMVVFGLNWLLHCLENAIFQMGKVLETAVDDLDSKSKK